MLKHQNQIHSNAYPYKKKDRLNEKQSPSKFHIK